MSRRVYRMSRTLFFAVLLALLCAGCSSSLQNAIGVANALGSEVATYGEQVNADFAKADHACLWNANGLAVTSSLVDQKACLDKVRASYAVPLKAYDDFVAIWTAFSFAVRAAETAEILGRAPDLTKIEALLPEVIRTADEFSTAYGVLVAPTIAAASTAAPIVKAVP